MGFSLIKDTKAAKGLVINKFFLNVKLLKQPKTQGPEAKSQMAQSW
jgi:hypothetical protein